MKGRVNDKRTFTTGRAHYSKLIIILICHYTLFFKSTSYRSYHQHNLVIIITSGRKRQVQNTTKVAFYACLYNGTNHLGNNQDIAFENALLNIGNSYNVHHGTFVAPVHGVYVFS